MNTEYKMKNVLFTSGRAVVTLDLARKFYSCGFTVYIAESLPRNLCKYCRAVKETFVLPSPRFFYDQYVQQLCQIVVDKKIDLIMPTCEEIFYIAGAREKIMAVNPKVQIFVDGFEKLQMLHNKWTFIQYLQGLNKLVPQTWLITSRQEFLRFCESEHSLRRVLVKPVYSRFAAKVFVWQKSDSVPFFDVSEEQPWLIQEFINGKQYCSYAICHDGVISAFAVYGADFTAGLGACVCFASVNHEIIHQWVENFVKKINFTGQIAFDFIESDTGRLYPLECNPRSTSGLHLFSDKQLVDAIIGTGKGIRPSGKSSKMLSMAMLYYGLVQCRCVSDAKKWFIAFCHADDVVFTWRDPIPFIYQLFVVKMFYDIQQKNKISIFEATTYDIEWNGEML